MNITLSKRAAKTLQAMNEPMKSRIKRGIGGLPMGDVKKLQGFATAYRLRVGDYRILYEMESGEIVIREILPRGEAYKNI